MDITSISLAYTGLKTAKDIIIDLTNLKVETKTLNKINDAVKNVGEAQDTLFALREELFKLQDENNSLRTKISDIESWDNKLNQYTLTGTNGGAIVYKSNNEPIHYVCPSCVAKQELHFLQQDDSSEYNGQSACPNCKTLYSIKKSKENPSIDVGGPMVL